MAAETPTYNAGYVYETPVAEPQQPAAAAASQPASGRGACPLPVVVVTSFEQTDRPTERQTDSKMMPSR